MEIPEAHTKMRCTDQRTILLYLFPSHMRMVSDYDWVWQGTMNKINDYELHRLPCYIKW